MRSSAARERTAPVSATPTSPSAQLRWEYLRSALVRPTEVAAQGSGLLLVVAVQHFDASSTAKALLAAATFIGLLVSPLITTAVARSGLAVSRALALLLTLAGAAIAAAAVSPAFGGFFAGVLLGVPLIKASAPLVTALWRQLASDARRGRLFSQGYSLAGLAGVTSALLIALYLGDDAGRYRPPLVALAALLALAAFAALQLRTTPLADTPRNPYARLSLLWRHRLFGAISGAWMLLGFGNLATVPLRVEWIGSETYGFGYSAALVLLLTAVLPQGTALVATLGWGRLFDRVRFLPLRLAINLFFAGSIVLFFTPWLAAQLLGSVLLGMAQGGGFVAWSLWVTKYAPADRTADYMSVHTFLTGTRGLLAPLFAYGLLEQLPLVTVTRIGLGLVIVSSTLIALIMRYEDSAARGSGET